MLLEKENPRVRDSKLSIIFSCFLGKQTLLQKGKMFVKLDYDPYNPLPVEVDQELVKYLEVETLSMANEGYVGNEVNAIWRQRAVNVIFKVRTFLLNTDSIYSMLFFIFFYLYSESLFPSTFFSSNWLFRKSWKEIFFVIVVFVNYFYRKKNLREENINQGRKMPTWHFLLSFILDSHSCWETIINVCSYYFYQLILHKTYLTAPEFLTFIYIFYFNFSVQWNQLFLVILFTTAL